MKVPNWGFFLLCYLIFIINEYTTMNTTIGLVIIITLSCVVATWLIKAKINENSKL